MAFGARIGGIPEVGIEICFDLWSVTYRELYSRLAASARPQFAEQKTLVFRRTKCEYSRRK
jgi:hypothetical protein